VTDVGTHSDEPADYPDYAAAVGAAVLDGRVDRGIVVCGSGVGVAIAANKLKGIRAAQATDTYTAHQAVEHDDVNVLALGAQITGPRLAWELVDAFLTAEFTGEERHVRRVEKIARLESGDQ
jgi:ribose 5-phosphate isomerase B